MTDKYISVTRRRTIYTFVWLGSFAGLQRSESINIVFDLTTLMVYIIVSAHTVFIYTTLEVISFVFSKEKSDKFIFLA